MFSTLSVSLCAVPEHRVLSEYIWSVIGCFYCLCCSTTCPKQTISTRASRPGVPIECLVVSGACVLVS
ncbi:hypothetical protein EB796_009786 [Bugula neritina]|uniref:Uncharacterized protein n=1 Tax=Bugula neritina TaxID=10212 RepID=A0A7J7K1Q0_BUGNE|nr:hypothetical protein EB796_009786 [Bugula neritina]